MKLFYQERRNDTNYFFLYLCSNQFYALDYLPDPAVIAGFIPAKEVGAKISGVVRYLLEQKYALDGGSESESGRDGEAPPG